jgi:hypothetical protein
MSDSISQEVETFLARPIFTLVSEHAMEFFRSRAYKHFTKPLNARADLWKHDLDYVKSVISKITSPKNLASKTTYDISKLHRGYTLVELHTINSVLAHVVELSKKEALRAENAELSARVAGLQDILNKLKIA